jgi:hypothetical protein
MKKFKQLSSWVTYTTYFIVFLGILTFVIVALPIREGKFHSEDFNPAGLVSGISCIVSAVVFNIIAHLLLIIAENTRKDNN